MDIQNFNQQNSHPRDEFVTFNEQEHIYTVNGKEMISVTALVSSFFERFDAEKTAQRMAAKNHCSPEEIMRQWEEKSLLARKLGTEMHASIEGYFMGNPIENVPADVRPLFSQFAADYNLQPYRTEWAIYDEDSGVAGTLDFLELKDGVYTIYDWKRSEKILYDGAVEKISRFGKMALHPIQNIPDTNFWHYALQLSMYRYILEKNYGIEVTLCRLGVFHPSYTTYHVVDVPYLKKEVAMLLSASRPCEPQQH